MQSPARDDTPSPAAPADCALADLRALQASLRRIPADEREPFIEQACDALRKACGTRKRSHTEEEDDASAASPTLPTRRRCANRFEEHVENALRILNTVRDVAPKPASPRRFLARPVRFCPLPCTQGQDEEEEEDNDAL